MDETQTIEKYLQQSRAAWVPPGEVVEIHGRVISGGMIYVGQHITGLHPSQTAEPALINPRLKATTATYTRFQNSCSSWATRAYARFNPVKRAAYLDWLAAERPNGAPSEFVDLFLMGLERRILFDARYDETAREEISSLLQEAQRLILELNQFSGAIFQTKLEEFTLTALAILPDFDPTLIEPPVDRLGWSSRLPLLLGLGAFARENRPLPAAWAYSWVVNSNESHSASLRPRCPEVFDPFFEKEYHQIFGDGIRIRTNPKKGCLAYQPVNPTFGGPVPIGREPLPNVGNPGREHAQLESSVAEISRELADFVAHIPWNAAGPMLSTYAYLPERAGLPREQHAVAPFVEILNEAMGEDTAIVIDKHSFMDAFPEISSTIPQGQATALSLLLERIGFGIEPDPVAMKSRFSRTKQIGLYRMEYGPDPYYANRDLSPLLALLGFWSYVAAVDGPIDVDAIMTIVNILDEFAELEPFEANRLFAHAHWLAFNPANLNDARRQFQTAGVFSPEQVGLMVTSLVSLHTPVSHSQIRALERMYKTLGLPTERVHTDLHQLSVGSLAPDPPGDRNALPRDTSLRLDRARIAQVEQQTSLVTDLLQDIFGTESAHSTPSEDSHIPARSAIDPIIELAKCLAIRSRWSPDDFAILCGSLDLMTSGAIEALNTRAIELGYEPAIECDDVLCEIDQSILKELLSHV